MTSDRVHKAKPTGAVTDLSEAHEPKFFADLERGRIAAERAKGNAPWAELRGLGGKSSLSRR
jgi:hypothetical protein